MMTEYTFWLLRWEHEGKWYPFGRFGDIDILTECRIADDGLNIISDQGSTISIPLSEFRQCTITSKTPSIVEIGLRSGSLKLHFIDPLRSNDVRDNFLESKSFKDVVDSLKIGEVPGINPNPYFRARDQHKKALPDIGEPWIASKSPVYYRKHYYVQTIGMENLKRAVRVLLAVVVVAIILYFLT